MYNMEPVDVDVALAVHYKMIPGITSFIWTHVWAGVRDPFWRSFRFPVCFSIIATVDEHIKVLTNSDTKI